MRSIGVFALAIFVLLVHGASAQDRRSGHPAGFRMYVSTDQGHTWKADWAPIEGLSTQGAVDPAALLMPNGDLLLYYLGSNQTQGDPARSQPDNTWRMIVARSTDGGRNFKEVGISYSETRGMTDPFALPTGDGAVRLYISRGAEVFSVTSPDGIVFKKEAGLRSNRKGGVPGALRTRDGTIYLFVCRREGIMRLKSRDGLSFSDDGVALRAEPGKFLCDPSPLADPGGGYVMAYKEKDAKVHDPRHDTVRLADSLDGRTWTARPGTIGTGSVPGLVIAADGVWRIYTTGPPPMAKRGGPR